MNSKKSSKNESASSKNEVDWSSVYQDIAKGNQDALAILIAWGELCHLFDDIIDEDKKRTPDEIGRIILSWTMVCTRNPLFQTHADRFIGIAMAAINAFIDSVDMEKSEDPGRRNFGDAYRSFYVELSLYVAFLVGGWDHYRAVSSKYRLQNYYSQREPQVDQIPLLPIRDVPVKDGTDVTLPEGRKGGRKEFSRPRILPYQLQSKEDWERFQTFAESFDHPVDRRFPHVVIKTSDDKWIGYGMMMCVPAPGSAGMPLICTGWHPSATQRECVRGMQLLTDWSLMAYGKVATVIPKDSPLLPHMSALGFDNWDLHFFATKP